MPSTPPGAVEIGDWHVKNPPTGTLCSEELAKLGVEWMPTSPAVNEILTAGSPEGDSSGLQFGFEGDRNYIHTLGQVN